MVECLTDATRELACRDGKAASQLKIISLFIIFLTSVISISSTVLWARFFNSKLLNDKAILVIKCFVAGVILSASLVHVFPDAFEALSYCNVAGQNPWNDFPFAGLLALIGILLVLLVNITGSASSHIEHGYGLAADEEGEELLIRKSGMRESLPETAEELMKLKRKLLSEVLEIGIIFPSVIVGVTVTIGMSQDQCSIRPLVAALAFHQILEGLSLGGCIAQAGFSFGTTAYMCLVFSVTTPVGIVWGMIVFFLTGYADNNANAIIMEGLLGSLSSGILMYVALVDLIALDFFHNKLLNCDPLMRKASGISLALGSASMSLLALWG